MHFLLLICYFCVVYLRMFVCFELPDLLIPWPQATCTVLVVVVVKTFFKYNDYSVFSPTSK